MNTEAGENNKYKKHSWGVVQRVLAVILALLLSVISGTILSVLSTHVETTIAAFEADVSIKPTINSSDFDSDVDVNFGALGRMYIQLNEDQRLALLSDFGLSVNVTVHDTVDGTVTNWKEFNLRSYSESLPGDIEKTSTGLLQKLFLNIAVTSSLIMLLILVLYLLIKLKKIRVRPLPVCAGVLIIALACGVFVFANHKPVVSTFSEELLAGTASGGVNTYEFDIPYGHVYIEGLGSEVAQLLNKTVMDNDAAAMQFVADVDAKIRRVLDDQVYMTNDYHDAILLVSDIHDNFYMARVASEIAKVTDAVFVLDDGDITTAGTGLEKYHVDKILGYFTKLEIPYIFTSGNHDKKDTIKQVEDAGGIAFTDKADIIEVESYRIAAANDPYFYFTDIKSDKEIKARKSAVEASAKELSKLINKSEEAGELIDLVLVHDPQIAQGVELDEQVSIIDPDAYSAIPESVISDSDIPDFTDESSEPDTESDFSTNRRLLFLTGHQHRVTTLLQRESDRLIFTATNTNGANRKLSDAMLTTGIGIPTKTVEFLVLLTLPGDEPGQHTPLGYYVVTITPKGAVSVSDVLLFD
jgi:predicted phosphodiesterase